VNASLEKSIDKINKDVETAQNVVKAIGFIDDAVAIAAKVAATISKAL
jgi:t-SNARE complex subunit (syntaxin)